MLSECKFVTRDDLKSALSIEQMLSSAIRDYQISALILCRVQEAGGITVTMSWPVPIEPLEGSDKLHVENVIKDCLKHPQAHVHAIGHLALPNILKRLKHEVEIGSKVWFVPMALSGEKILALFFPHHSNYEKVIPEAFTARVYSLIDALLGVEHLATLEATISVMEKYVKEVGHDIASSVQSTIAKLRNISDGIIPQEFMGIKAREAEMEIMAAYRVAEGLGVTMEQNYQVREFKPFNLVDVVRDAVGHHESEANERNILIEHRGGAHEILLVGDSRAFEQLVGHLLSNAIKYSRGNTTIYVDLSRDSEFASLKVRNLGIPLPAGPDIKKIWDFGYRGGAAKQRHVNGSGIGLYTVRKIALAHHGLVSCGHDGSSSVTWFDVKVPLVGFLKKHFPELFLDALASGRG